MNLQHGRVGFGQRLKQPFPLQNDGMLIATKSKGRLKNLFVFLGLLRFLMGKANGNRRNIFVNHPAGKAHNHQEHRFNLMSTEGFVRIMRDVDDGCSVFIHPQRHTAPFADEPLVLLHLLQRLKEVLAVHHGVGHHIQIVGAHPLAHGQPKVGIST